MAAGAGRRLDAVAVVDAAFARYAREAADYAGGRMHSGRTEASTAPSAEPQRRGLDALTG